MFSVLDVGAKEIQVYDFRQIQEPKWKAPGTDTRGKCKQAGDHYSLQGHRYRQYRGGNL